MIKNRDESRMMSVSKRYNFLDHYSLMKQIRVKTDKQLQVLDITRKVKDKIDIKDGYTTAAITIQEPDTELWEDLLNT